MEEVGIREKVSLVPSAEGACWRGGTLHYEPQFAAAITPNAYNVHPAPPHCFVEVYLHVRRPKMRHGLVR